MSAVMVETVSLWPSLIKDGEKPVDTNQVLMIEELGDDCLLVTSLAATKFLPGMSGLDTQVVKVGSGLRATMHQEGKGVTVQTMSGSILTVNPLLVEDVVDRRVRFHDRKVSKPLAKGNVKPLMRAVEGRAKAQQGKLLAFERR